MHHQQETGSRGYSLLDKCRIQVIGRVIYVGENRAPPRQGNGHRGGGSGESGGDNLVSLLQAQSLEGQDQGVGARGHSDTLTASAIGGELFLQGFYLGPQNVMSVGKEALKGFTEFAPYFLFLAGYIQKGNH